MCLIYRPCAATASSADVGVHTNTAAPTPAAVQLMALFSQIANSESTPRRAAHGSPEVPVRLCSRLLLSSLIKLWYFCCFIGYEPGQGLAALPYYY